MDSHWQITPVIMEETGYFGPEYTYTVPKYIPYEMACKYAFIYLEALIQEGKMERKIYG